MHRCGVYVNREVNAAYSSALAARGTYNLLIRRMIALRELLTGEEYGEPLIRRNPPRRPLIQGSPLALQSDTVRPLPRLPRTYQDACKDGIHAVPSAAASLSTRFQRGRLKTQAETLFVRILVTCDIWLTPTGSYARK